MADEGEFPWRDPLEVYFHVVVVQRRQRNVPKKCAARANLLFSAVLVAVSLVFTFEKRERLGRDLGAGASSGQRVTRFAHALRKNHFVIVD